jgi:transposase InsO family protein
MRLLVEIRASFEASKRTYGSPRVLKDLRGLGYRVSRKRIERMMRENGLQAIMRRRFRCTTNSAHEYPVAANLLARRFEVDRPNHSWVGDITYIPTEEGWLYLAVLLDLYSRRVVGWNAAEKIDALLAIGALDQALRMRAPAPGLLHHSDRGSQYASYDYQERLRQAQVTTSMSRKGNCYDNAVAESFFSSLKRERVDRRRYWTREEAIADIRDYIDFYNRRRRHSYLDGLCPVDFENRATLT